MVKKRPAVTSRGPPKSAPKKSAPKKAVTKSKAPSQIVAPRKPEKQAVVQTSQRKMSVIKRPACTEITVTKSQKMVIPHDPRRRSQVLQPPPSPPVTRSKRAAEVLADVASIPGAAAKPPPRGVFVKNNPSTTDQDTQATFENVKFAEGNFRNVHRGTYVKGARTGEQCVMKEFKSGCVFESTFFENDIRAVNKAGEIIEAFNNLGVVSKQVYLNQPEVWTGYSGRIHKQKILVEPMIKGEYFKFNSNTGYTSPDSGTMQALSHFSYHYSNGKYLLCDLQGGRSSGFYILTDPVIHSKDKEFGATDLGEKGINNFMAYHECGRFCNRNWKIPKAENLVPVFEAVSGTTFGSGKELFNSATMQDIQKKSQTVLDGTSTE